MTGAEQLRKHLEDSHTSQADFALRAGVSTASVSQWLSGKSLPGRASALLIQSASGGAVPYTAWDGEAVKGKGSGRAVVSQRHARTVAKRAV